MMTAVRDRAIVTIALERNVKYSELSTLVILNFKPGGWIKLNVRTENARTIRVSSTCAALIQQWIDTIRQTNAAYHNGLPLFPIVTKEGKLTAGNMTADEIKRVILHHLGVTRTMEKEKGTPV